MILPLRCKITTSALYEIKYILQIGVSIEGHMQVMWLLTLELNWTETKILSYLL